MTVLDIVLQIIIFVAALATGIYLIARQFYSKTGCDANSNICDGCKGCDLASKINKITK